MPTVTSLSQYAVSNVGPLTTTFTAPPACTSPANVQLAPVQSPEMLTWAADCNLTRRYECTPSGNRISSAMASMDEANPAYGFQIPYYSPGLICPSGWVTVGMLAKSADGKESRSGVFAPQTTTTSVNGDQAADLPMGPAFPAPMDVFEAALLPSETAALCCPGSFTPAQAGGWCYSTLPSYTPTLGCVRFLPVSDIMGVSTQVIGPDGGTTPAVELSLTATAPATQTSVTTFAPGAAAELVGVSVENMVTLVYRAADVSATSAPSGLKGLRGSRRSIWDGEGANFALAIAMVAAVLGSFAVLA
jgi:hypothetical protein